MAWVVVGVQTSGAWPQVETKVMFLGRELVLRPEGPDQSASIALQQLDREDQNAALSLVHQFMSALSWPQGQGIRAHIVVGGGYPVRVGKPPGNNISTTHFPTDYLPVPSDAKAKLALALYREALTVNSVPYQFLGFFKVINIGLKSHRALQRISEQAKSVPDVAEYLYVSGRCAVAHAFNDPLVNPDDPFDENRLRDERRERSNEVSKVGGSVAGQEKGRRGDEEKRQRQSASEPALALSV